MQEPGGHRCLSLAGLPSDLDPDAPDFGIALKDDDEAVVEATDEEAEEDTIHPATVVPGCFGRGGGTRKEHEVNLKGKVEEEREKDSLLGVDGQEEDGKGDFVVSGSIKGGTERDAADAKSGIKEEKEGISLGMMESEEENEDGVFRTGDSKEVEEVGKTDAVLRMDDVVLEEMDDVKVQEKVDGVLGMRSNSRDEKGLVRGTKKSEDFVKENIDEGQDASTKTVQLDSLEGNIQKMEDNRIEEWQVVGDSPGNDNDGSQPDDLMSYGSESFESDSDEETEDEEITIMPKIAKSFNIEQLRDSIQNGETTLRSIEGKDVVLVIGKTGTGKSTLIQGIAGKKFVRSCYTSGSGGKLAKKDVFEAIDPVPEFEIGHAKSSKTKHIQCFMANGRNRKKMTSDDDRTPDELCYVDTPGFDDTNGEDIDIATSAMLAQIAEKCRTMRFIVMIHFVSLIEDRGGALRSLLKFIRNFVYDFDKNKRSFLFLFTHTEEFIHSAGTEIIPDSVGAAKKRILNEIILLAEGTKGGDNITTLLSFIRKSLKKESSHVDVFHPMETDISKITRFIQGRLKPIDLRRDDGCPTRCVLTNSSKLRLAGAIDDLLANLSLSLRDEPVDAEKVRGIQNTLGYLERYVNFDDIRAAVRKCNEAIADHIDQLHAIVDYEVTNGTTTSVDSLFNERNVAILRNALQELEAIDPMNFDFRSEREKIFRKVISFQKSLFLHKTSKLEGFHENLQKLAAWGSLDPEYQDLFEEVVSRGNAIAQQVVDEVSTSNPYEFCSYQTRSKLTEKFLSLRFLKSIVENQNGLSSFLAGTSNAASTYNCFVQKLITYLEVFDDDIQISPHLQILDFRDPQLLRNIANQIRALEELLGLLDKTNLHDDVYPLVRDVCKSIETQVVEKFEKACVEAQAKGRSGDIGYSFDRFQALRVAASTFSIFNGDHWKEMELSYSAMVDRVESNFKIKSGELDEMSRNALEHGLADGERDGRIVKNFGTWRSFDELLPSEQRFVAISYDKIKDGYSRRLKFIGSTIDKTVATLLNNFENQKLQPHLIENTKTLNTKLVEVTEFARLGCVIEDEELHSLSSQIFSKVHDYTQERVTSLRTVIKKWVHIISSKDSDLEKLAVLTEKIDISIGEINEFIKSSSELDGRSIASDPQCVKEEVMVAFSNFKQDVQECLSSQLPYADLVALLDRVRALGDFSRTAPHLPRVESLRNAIRQYLDKEFKNIEDMIDETSEFDTIDDRLEAIEKVKVFDEFIVEDVKSRIRSLKSLHEGKEADAEKVVMNMIEKNDFRGLGEFLKPLSETKNQIRKSKFSKSIQMIAQSLTEIDDKIGYVNYEKMTDEKGSKVAEYLAIMEQANNEIAEYLNKPMFVPSLVIRLKNRREAINSNFCKLQDNMSASIKNADFKLLVIQNQQTTIYSNHLGKYLSMVSKDKMKSNLSELCSIKKSIPTHINKFVRSSFTESASIEKILTGLKSAVIPNDTFDDISVLYVENTKILKEQVNCSVQTLKQSTEDAQCYDDSIVIVKNLLRSSKLGLKDHLPTELLNEAESLLEAWDDARSRQESEFDFSSATFDVTINEFARILDQNAPTSTLWSSFSQLFTGQNSSRTYDRKREELIDNVQQRYHRGRLALERREFPTLKNSLEFLSLVDLKAGKHIKLATEKQRDLEHQAIMGFRLLCKKSQEALQAGNYKDFEFLFDDFRGFVLHITCIMEDFEAANAFHLTNYVVYERLSNEISSLKAMLGGFEFTAIKQKVESVRRFGGSIADTYSLFHEELNVCTHASNDQWTDGLKTIISKHFQYGRDLKRIKYFVVLGIPPSSSKKQIEKAYRKKSLTSHPDKCRDAKYKQEWNDRFLMIKEAYDELSTSFLSNTDSSKPFDAEIRSIGDKLRDMTRSALNEQQYGRLETLLFKLHGIDVLICIGMSNLETNKIRHDVISLVKNRVQDVRSEANTNWSEGKYQNLNYNIEDLKSMGNAFGSHQEISCAWDIEFIVEKVRAEIDRLRKEAHGFLQNIRYVNRCEFDRCFMRMGAILIELPRFKDYAKEAMLDILRTCLDSSLGYSFVFELGLSLKENKDQARIAQNVLSEFWHFEHVLTMIFNEETIPKPIEYTVKKIRGNRFDSRTMNTTCLDLKTNVLIEKYSEFNKHYTAFLGEYLKPEADVRDLVQTTVANCDALKPVTCANGFGDETKRALPLILAGIFAVFTINKSGESYRQLEDDAMDARKLLMKPHNVQVLTLLCMFGCGTSGTSLQSQLMQIRTGEGKSMILGAASIVLGLLGFRVRCVCYSKYLSNRDHELYRDVFNLFELSKRISYNMIKDHMEETIVAKGDIRSLTSSLLYKTLRNARGSNFSAIEKNEIEEIMLVDEVDVFFGSDFYGETHNPVVHVKEPEIATILRHIWETHKQEGGSVAFHDIQNLPAYKKLMLKFPNFKSVVDREISEMLSDVHYVDSPPYYLDDDTDRIGYKQHDDISYGTVYGYRTTFAYMKEADEGNLIKPKEVLSRELVLTIKCGRFSYASIKPARILGVSGTLEVMSNYEKAVLHKYGVDQYLYVPSVYRESNFVFDKVGNGISIEKEVGDFFQRITQQISKVATKQERAVIVFFKDLKRLDDFINSGFYGKLVGHKTETLTEKQNKTLRSYVISKAATVGQITLCTSVFGRGTDFFCKDSRLENSGGVHVIQAFLSADMSEEIQIQGRTARQGKDGSYELILLEQDLKNDFDIHIGSSDAWPRNEFYTRLCDARKQVAERKYAEMEKRVSEAEKMHEATHNYFDALLDSNVDRAKKLLKKLYRQYAV